MIPAQAVAVEEAEPEVSVPARGSSYADRVQAASRRGPKSSWSAKPAPLATGVAEAGED